MSLINLPNTKIKDKLFPSGIWAFVCLEFISSFLGYLFDFTWPYLGYVLFAVYVFYLFYVINKEHVVSFIPIYLQWLIFLAIPFISIIVIILRLQITINELATADIFAILLNVKYTNYISAVFFFCTLLIWAVVLVIMQLNNSNAYYAYAATCIPIRVDSTIEKMTVCLINNRSHNKSAWMFPGGHFDLSKNFYNQKDGSLSNISIIPENIVKTKAREEAGLLNLTFVSFSDFRANLRQLKTGWGLIAPAFNYLFKVSDAANCYSVLQHRIHLDFTYVATYSGIEPKPAYDTLEFVLEPNKLPQEEEKAISDISFKLTNAISQKYKPASRERENAHDLFPDSIPEMIYCACKYYERYLNL